MSRSETVRQEVLQLDNHRGQITGFDGRDEKERKNLAVHHKDELGMGGSVELDTVENCITLWGKVHTWIHSGALEIVEWDREGGKLVVIDHQGVLYKEKGHIPDNRLWFHRRQRAETLEPIVETIQGMHKIDGAVALALHELWEGDAYQLIEILGSESQSFSDFTESQGWDTGRARRLVELYRTGLDNGLTWPSGMSATDFRRQLKDAGFITPREYVYLELSKPLHELVEQGAVVPRWVTDEEFADLQTIGVKAGKWFGVKRHGKVLVQSDGHEIELIEKPKEAVAA